MDAEATAPAGLGPPLSEAELAEVAELAATADPETQAAAGAVSLWDLAGWDRTPLLPGWYMPAPMQGRSSPTWHRWVIGLIVASFLLINAYGLCSTYGRVG